MRRSEEVKETIEIKTLSSALSSHSAYEKYTQIDNQYAARCSKAGSLLFGGHKISEEGAYWEVWIRHFYNILEMKIAEGMKGVALLGHKDGAWLYWMKRWNSDYNTGTNGYLTRMQKWSQNNDPASNDLW